MTENVNSNEVKAKRFEGCMLPKTMNEDGMELSMV